MRSLLKFGLDSGMVHLRVGEERVVPAWSERYQHETLLALGGGRRPAGNPARFHDYDAEFAHQVLGPMSASQLLAFANTVVVAGQTALLHELLRLQHLRPEALVTLLAIAVECRTSNRSLDDGVAIVQQLVDALHHRLEREQQGRHIEPPPNSDDDSDEDSVDDADGSAASSGDQVCSLHLHVVHTMHHYPKYIYTYTSYFPPPCMHVPNKHYPYSYFIAGIGITSYLGILDHKMELNNTLIRFSKTITLKGLGKGVLRSVNPTAYGTTAWG